MHLWEEQDFFFFFFIWAPQKFFFVSFLKYVIFLKTFVYLSFLAWDVSCAVVKAVHIKVNWFSRLKKWLAHRRLGCKKRRASRKEKKKKKTNLPVILLKRNSQRDWMKGESLFRMAAFGWSAAWKPSGRDQERPPHVILIQRLVETAQTWIQMQPQGIHFPQPPHCKLSQNAYIFLFGPIIKQFYGILGME